ncbi:hypothetical protein HYC85_020701, partial [Camellia sinensis]
ANGSLSLSGILAQIISSISSGDFILSSADIVKIMCECGLLIDMEERVRSGGGLVKKKNSSGCLIIKKRGVGVGSSGSRKVFESNKERKRPRLVVSESESSDSESLEPIRRKVVSGADKFHNGSAVYRKDIVEDSKLGRNGEIESDKKRRLDVFEFDEYDGIDGKRMRMDFSQDRFKLTGRGGSEREFETGSSRHVMIDKGKNSHVDSRSNSSGRTGKSRYETEDDEAHLPISSLKQKFRVSSDEPIRLQGKNWCFEGDDSKRPDKAMSFVKTEKSELKLQNSLSKSAKAGNSETKDCDASLKLGSTSVQAHTSLKGEQAYWSIIKAYDALQKQLDEEDVDIKPSGDCSSFTPLPEEMLSKLTRQTRKKIEKEMKLKRRDHGRSKKVKKVSREESSEGTDGENDDDKLSFFMKQNGKPPKGRSYASGDDSSGNLNKGSPKQDKAEKPSSATNFHMIQGRKSRKIGRCTLLVRSSDKGLNSESDGCVPYTGKRTLLSWLIDSGTMHGIDKTSPNALVFTLWTLMAMIQMMILVASAADGGDLICCDGCPSTFHQSCLDIEMLPPGDWHCPNCTCKFCGIAGEISAQGTVSALLTCSLYHESCSQEIDALPADTNGASTSFCGQKCRELFDHLQKLLGVKHELEAGFSWSLIHRTDLDTDASHRGYSQRVECNSKLAVALSVMDECFLPIVDRRSGVNLIHNVVYNCGSNFSRLNYTGFYTVILERGDEIIAAASIRIHGTQLAEMPFIGTRHIYRRQGMCRRLFCAIESALGSLKVEKLIIPAIAEHMHTWTVVFGFYPLEESQKQEMRSVNMLVFPGTDMLQKLLGELKTTEGKVTANSDAKPVPIKEDHHLTPDLTKKDDVDSSVGHDLNICDDDGLHNADKTDDKAAAVDSSLQAPAVPSNDNALLDSSLNVPSEPKLDVLSESQSVKESTDEENPAGLHNADETDDKAAAVDSGLQAPALPLHDSVRLDSSLDVPSEPKLNVLSESQPVKESSDEENPILDPSVKGNSSEEGVVNTVQEANVEVAVIEPVIDLFGESSVINTAEEIKGDQNPLCACAINGTDEDTKQSNSELSPQPAEGNVESNAEGYKHDAHHAKVKVSCAGPSLDSLGEISAQNTTEKISENHDPVPVSSLHGTDDCIASDLNQLDTLGIESKLNVALQVNNIESSAVSTHEVNDKVANVEPGLDCFGEISAQNKDINEDQDHAAVSMLNGSDESAMQLDSDLNKQSALEVESNSHAASEVVSDEEVALVGRNILPSAEDDVGKEAHEVNVSISSVEPVLNSSGETSAENATFDGSNGSTVQLESDQNHPSAIEMETEGRVDSEVASDAMDCERNI